MTKAAPMRRVTVNVAPAYQVLIGRGLLPELAAHIGATTIALISDEQVAAQYLDRVKGGLEHTQKRVIPYTVSPGESSKSLPTYGELLRQLARDGIDRSAAVLALGGGVVGDLAGFVAASYMRGIAFYQCPTSLLAMVDASVGGKTGLNLPEGKNLVGAFWQPQEVFADIDTLTTLPEHEFKQGAVELFKHGLLADPSILEAMTSPEFHRHGDATLLSELIYRSVKVKAEIVAMDEREAGKRAHLNLGHTLAHALEAYSHHQDHPSISHGDAVAYGLLFAAKLAAQRGFADETSRISEFLHWVQPSALHIPSFEVLLPYLQRDKKHQGGTQRWVLLEQIGAPVIIADLQEHELQTAWRYLQETATPMAVE